MTNKIISTDTHKVEILFKAKIGQSDTEISQASLIDKIQEFKKDNKNNQFLLIRSIMNFSDVIESYWSITLVRDARRPLRKKLMYEYTEKLAKYLSGFYSVDATIITNLTTRLYKYDQC